jgi:tetratricopeptide (TPR) repeat protein
VPVVMPALKQGRAAGLRRNGWRRLAAAVGVVAAVSFVLMASLRHADGPGQVPREPQAQEAPPVPQTSKSSPVTRPHGESAAGPAPVPVPVPPVAPPRDVQGVPPAKYAGVLSTQTPQSDLQAAPKVEIDALDKESVEIVRTLIHDFPNASDPLGLMGMLYNRCDQTAKALECWEKASNVDPNRPDLYDAMATIALRKGEYDKAAGLCRQGLAKSGQLPHLHYQLAEALNGLGRAEESVKESLRAIALDPDNGGFHCLLGKTYALLGEHEKSRISYETAVKLQPRSVAARYGLAVACAKLGKEEQSNQVMEQYRKLQAQGMENQRSRRGVADDARKHRQILALTCSDAATVYLGKGRSGMAESLLRRGAEADSENANCRIQLAQLLFKAGRLPETVPILQELLKIEPDNALYHLRLGMMCARTGRIDEARKAAKKATELAPDSEECRRFLEQLQAKE